MPQELLNCPDVVAVLQEVSGKGVPEGMGRRRFRETRLEGSFPDGTLDDRFVQVVPPPQCASAWSPAALGGSRRHLHPLALCTEIAPSTNQSWANNLGRSKGFLSAAA